MKPVQIGIHAEVFRQDKSKNSDRMAVFYVPQPVLTKLGWTMRDRLAVEPTATTAIISKSKFGKILCSIKNSTDGMIRFSEKHMGVLSEQRKSRPTEYKVDGDKLIVDLPSWFYRKEAAKVEQPSWTEQIDKILLDGIAAGQILMYIGSILERNNKPKNRDKQ